MDIYLKEIIKNLEIKENYIDNEGCYIEYIETKELNKIFNNVVSKQKVKEKIERHKIVKECFEKEYDNKHYEDDGIRARDFYGIVTQDRIIQVLEELLEDK